MKGPQLLALFTIALVVACAIGMGLVAVRDGRAARRAERTRPAERWRR